MDPFETKSFTAGGSRNVRSDSVTVRLEPRIRYFAELASRIDRRTLSSFVEQAIADAITRKIIRVNPRDPKDPQVRSLMEQTELWDVFEPDRFVKLALHHPELLTHHEQIVWKLIQENEVVWKHQYDNDGDPVWAVQESEVLWRTLRKYWEVFNKVARGELPISALPSVESPRGTSDEEIPF
jgi:hypothetical protein